MLLLKKIVFQDSTYHFINVAPQWQSFNGRKTIMIKGYLPMSEAYIYIYIYIYVQVSLLRGRVRNFQLRFFSVACGITMY